MMCSRSAEKRWFGASKAHWHARRVRVVFIFAVSLAEGEDVVMSRQEVRRVGRRLNVTGGGGAGPGVGWSCDGGEQG